MFRNLTIDDGQLSIGNIVYCQGLCRGNDVCGQVSSNGEIWEYVLLECKVLDIFTPLEDAYDNANALTRGLVSRNKFQIYKSEYKLGIIRTICGFSRHDLAALNDKILRLERHHILVYTGKSEPGTEYSNARAIKASSEQALEFFYGRRGLELYREDMVVTGDIDCIKINGDEMTVVVQDTEAMKEAHRYPQFIPTDPYFYHKVKLSDISALLRDDGKVLWLNEKYHKLPAENTARTKPELKQAFRSIALNDLTIPELLSRII